MAKEIDRWELMTAFFEEKGLVRQHLDSYNAFIKEGIQQLVDEVGKIEPDIEGYFVEFGKIRVEEPNVTEADGSIKKVSPSEARIRNLTYSAPIYLEMTPVFKDFETGIEERGETIDIYIGRIPIMLKSERCGLAHLSSENLVKVNEDPRDPGGYFIVNGSERVLVTQEDLAPNRILTEEAGSSSSATHVAKVFSTARGFRAPVTLERTKDNELKVSFPSIPGKIPLVILVRALGVITDKEIMDTFSEDFEIRRELIPTLEAATPIYVPKDRDETRKNALDYIGRRVAIGQTIEYRLRRAEQVLDRYLLPHIGMKEEDRIRKSYYLTQMAQRLVELVLGKRVKDDKDHYSNKRLKLAGELLTSLFRVAFLNLVRDVKYQLERTAVRGRKPNIRTAVRADVITERLKHALATGNWVGGKAGVSQLLDRTNYISTLSHLRRIVSPLSRSQPHFEARDLHPTHWGRICVAPKTLVAMGDRVTQIPISDLEQTYSEKIVSTVNLADFRVVPSRLHDYQKYSPIELNKKVYRITTISGRTIEATEDHPFFTARGWISAKDLKVNDRVLVIPGIEPTEIGSKQEPQAEILSEKEFLEGEWTSKLNSSEKKRLAGYADKLKQLGLLPLTNADPKLPIIARLFGHVITDGSIGKTVEFYCGCREDVENIQRDLLNLGFKPTSISTKTGIFPSDGKELIYTTERTTKGGSFLFLMLALGCPRGRRVSQPSIFPEWVQSSSVLVQREFLGGYLGGDGSAPRFYKRSEEDRKDSYKIRLDRIAGHKEKDFASTLKEFFKEMRVLFDNFSIKTLGIKSKSLDGGKIQVSLQFSQEHANIMKIAKSIGFRYCKEKQSKAALVQEYLNYKEREISIRSRYIQEAILLFKDGMTKRKIAKHLSLKFNRNITHRAIDALLQRIDKPRKLVLPKSSMNINAFFQETCANLENGFLYLPIDRIEESDLDDVRDFTTVSKNHNFIANGFLTHNCPNETPEGPNCGLVKNLALMAYISVGTDEGVVENVLLNLGVYPAEEVIKDKTKRGAQVFLNGRLVGVHPKPKELIEKTRTMRRKGEIHDEVNVAYDSETNEIQINCDSGRARRPLIIVEDGVPRLKPEHIEQLRNKEIVFSDLVSKGIIEYLDSEEEENSFIALLPEDLTSDHTNLEIAPSAILGITASTTPFPEHNQSPRNVYQAGMSKQALGVYATNYRHRVDTRSHLLHYPQRPIVKTKAMDSVGFASRPAGQNLVVAILSFQGYNLEDALVINKASVQRGVGRGTFFRSYEAEERKYPGGQEDRFEIPEKSVRGYRIAEAYRHLAEDGIIEPEIEVTGGDVLIGRSSPPRFLEEYSEFEAISPIRRETSINMRHGEKGVVDTVILSETMDGSKLIKIKVRDQRIPELGDKFASRHGQKGIIGLIVPQEDMPFTGDGIVPDLIINPHAIPSRMTVGQIIEGVAGKVGALKGDIEGIDGNAFSGEKGEVLFKMLKELGYKHTGREVMYDGMTGRKYAADIFMALVYYQKLHHMVADKMHARARGPVQILTRQPTEGRAREGGLRFGEMERDCLIGHGAALVLKERLLDESDKYNMLICEKCGTIGVYDRNKDRYYCPMCGDKGRVSQVSVSYAFKLLLQELMSLGLFPKVDIKEKA